VYSNDAHGVQVKRPSGRYCYGQDAPPRPAPPRASLTLLTSLARLASTLKDVRLVSMELVPEDALGLEQLTAVMHLDVRRNQLGDQVTRLSTLTALTHLDISENTIASPFSARPFAALTRLHTLGLGLASDMRYSPWSDLSTLTACQRLRELSFTGHPLDSVAHLSGLTTLKMLDISTCDCEPGYLGAVLCSALVSHSADPSPGSVLPAKSFRTVSYSRSLPSCT
jgi:hypothetical protein